MQDNCVAVNFIGAASGALSTTLANLLVTSGLDILLGFLFLLLLLLSFMTMFSNIVGYFCRYSVTHPLYQLLNTVI